MCSSNSYAGFISGEKQPSLHHLAVTLKKSIFVGQILVKSTTNSTNTLRKCTYQKKLHKKSKWITNGILNSINKKDKLYKTLIQTDTNNTVLYERLKTEFKEYRGGLRKTIRKAKRDFYIHIYNRHKNDIKKTWSLINETLNRNLRKQSTYEFLVDDQMISNPMTIANKFNEYFAHIDSTLADKIPAAPHFNNYLNNPVVVVQSGFIIWIGKTVESYNNETNPTLVLHLLLHFLSV